ncbi:hypothetical protein Q8A67_023772 [Cirrhinus molitorella]|uniref:Uncharacterized protein n=1 Tax=Cirrhinus molitorella TaxID=172907 RepID=A0AA88P6D6_9TELE|nr:hypothetical protein Q8A67_023772 [Cirrhinus molitorella]
MCRVDRDADQQVSVCLPTTDRMEQMDREGNFSTPNGAVRTTFPRITKREKLKEQRDGERDESRRGS